MSDKCPKCGAERTIEWPDGDDFECRTVTNGKGEILRIGDPCKISELTRENADLKSQLAARMTMEQVCEALNLSLNEEPDERWWHCNDIADALGVKFVRDDNKFIPRKAVSDDSAV